MLSALYRLPHTTEWVSRLAELDDAEYLLEVRGGMSGDIAGSKWSNVPRPADYWRGER